MNIPLFDMHSHILPGMDDGARNSEESMALLEQASSQGIRAMVCSSHYYPRETVLNYLERRSGSVDQLMQVLPKASFPVPRLYLGAEAAWFPGMPHIDHIDRLCIGKTRYLLVEPDFAPWTDSFFQDLYVFSNVLGITPIIAHLERYLAIQDKRKLRQLLESDVLIQMNAEAILHPKTASTAKKLLKKGYINLLGSDCHRVDTRPENLGDAVQQLLKWKFENTLEEIIACSRVVLNDPE